MLEFLNQTDPMLLGALGALGVFIAVTIFVFGFVPDDIEEADIYGYRLRKRNNLREESPIYELALPLIKIFAHYFRAVPGGFFSPLDDLRQKLRVKLPRSGYVGAFTPNEFLGACCTAGLALFVLGLVMSFYMTGQPQLPIACIAAGVGLYLPFLQLDSAVQERMVEINRRLPYTMDLLVLSMRAGLDFMTALDRVVTQGKQQNPDDPIIQEFGVVVQELRVGTPRAEAMMNLVDRVDSEYLNSMVGAIIQAEKRGTPLAQVLETQVDTIRNKRSQRIEKEASEASVKILMPLMFIFGAVLVVVLGAMYLRIQSAGGM